MTMRKVQKMGALTIHFSLLDGKSSDTPNGMIHAQVATTIEEGEGAAVKEYAAVAGDRYIKRADLVERARTLYLDVAQHLADEDQMNVRASLDFAAPLVSPREAVRS
jgi:hypothetical protein